MTPELLTALQVGGPSVICFAGGIIIAKKYMSNGKCPADAVLAEHKELMLKQTASTEMLAKSIELQTNALVHLVEKVLTKEGK